LHSPEGGLCFPIRLFSGTEKRVFEHGERTHPIYFEFLTQSVDDITVEVPVGWQTAGLPKPQNQDLRVVGYAVSAESSQGALHLTQKLEISVLTIGTKYLPSAAEFLSEC